MKLVAAALVTIFFGGLLVVGAAHAQEATSMTDDHISRIKNSCQPALATLTQIRTNDGPVFVNRNQAYFSISDKLMARLNSRLALDRYDTTALVRIGNDFNTALNDFRTTYKRYNDTMAELVRMNCSRQPVSFYDKVTEARQLREQVHIVVVRLHDEIENYRQAVATFKSDNEMQLKGVRDE